MNIRQKRVFVKNAPWRFDSGAAKQSKESFSLLL